MSSTVAELRVKRNTLKAQHQEGSAVERRALTREIGDLLKRRRAIEARLKVPADLPADQCPPELRAVAEEIEALRAKRAPMLRPVELDKVQADLRQARKAEDAERAAEIVAGLGLDQLSDEELDALGQSFLAARTELVIKGTAVQAEVSRRNIEKARRARFRGMTREQKLDELRALRAEVGEDE